MYKLIIAILFLFSLGWVNLFLTAPTISAETAEEVYLQPIPGLKAGLFGITAKTVIESLIDDNYQAYCAAPTQVIGPEVLGEYKRFLDLYFGEVNEKEKPLETVVSDPSSITNPDIWDGSGDGYKGESVVNYQYRNKTDVGKPSSNIVTDGINRQRTLYQQCINVKATRKDVIGRCGELKDTKLSDCPLNIDIPGMSGIQIADIDIDCDNLLDEEKFAKIDKVKLAGMANIPDASAIKTNMKPAYLMICFEQKNGVGRWHDGTKVEDKKFWINSIWSWINSNFLEKKGECSIRTIQIPVAITEQNPKYEDYALEVQDAGKKFFMSLSQQTIEEEKFKKARSARKELALGEMNSGFLDNKLIRLRNSDDEFKKALAFIINGTAPACTNETIRPEEAPTIGIDSVLKEGGAKYKISEDTAYGTWSKGGKLASLVTKFVTTLFTGKRVKDDFEGRIVYVRSYIFAPYANKDKSGAAERISLQQFFLPKRDYEKIRFMAQEYWQTHINFQDFLVSSATNEKCETYEDYEKCHFEWRCSEIYGCRDVKICPQKEFCVTGKDLGQQYSTPTSYMRDDMRPIFSLVPYGSIAWKQANENLGDPANTGSKTNIEKFLKSEGSGDGGSGDGDDGNGEMLACEEYKDRETKLPTMNELMRMTCSVAGNNAMDAQLLWGLIQIEASPMLRRIRAGDKSMSCSEIITNSCGASGITGQLVPQCIDKDACSQAAYIANDTTDPWIKKIRENPKISCDIKTQLEYTLAKRRSGQSSLIADFKILNGYPPTSKEIYYMMAGRNYGVPPEYLFQPACGDYEAVDGCDGANYCVCAMDNFILDCGNIK